MRQYQSSFFDQTLDRRGKSTKWDAPPYGATPGDDLIPMWIADMDFAVPDCVSDAVRHRLDHPTMGYFRLDRRFYDAVIDWQRQRRGVTDLTPERIVYQNSTIGALQAAITMLTEPGDGVLLHQPHYNGFATAVKSAGRRMVLSPLLEDGQGVFGMDFDSMQRLVTEEKLSLVILCSPHNPTGRVWSREELTAFSDFCQRNRLTVLADEIWADFVFAPAQHIPTWQVSDYLRENTISFHAPSKAFNLAGLRVAYSITYGDALAARWKEFCTRDHYNVANVLSAEALIGAYTEGAPYVDALLEYVRANMVYVRDRLARELPSVSVALPDGTYTLWLDLRALGLSDEEVMRRFLEVRMIPNASGDYSGSGFVRLNLACPRTQVEAALDRMVKALG